MKNYFSSMKKEIIVGLFITSIIIANVVTGKILNIFGFIIPGGFLAYAVTFLMTDLLSELYGKKEANKTVFLGFICSVFASLLILFTKYLPFAEFASDPGKAYDILLGTNYRFVIASMLAYYVSQSWDIWIFHVFGKATKGKHKWLRNNASTMTSQFFDTTIFITIAFLGVVPNLFWMIISQYIIKVFIALFDTPFFYFFTRKRINEDF